jgi:hypothetical protein
VIVIQAIIVLVSCVPLAIGLGLLHGAQRSAPGAGRTGMNVAGGILALIGLPALAVGLNFARFVPGIH